MLKIIAGEYRSRQLQSPVGRNVTRPITARVKESVFNLLRGWFDNNENVVDLFAGVGSIGLEAASRGAGHVLMVERHRGTFRILEENIASLGCKDRAQAMMGDALSPLVFLRAPKPIDVLFLDPPYPMMHDEQQRLLTLKQIEVSRPYLNSPAMVVLRTPDLDETVNLSIPGFDGPERHNYGHDMAVHLYMPAKSE